jgi:hypothetical protein
VHKILRKKLLKPPLATPYIGLQSHLFILL